MELNKIYPFTKNLVSVIVPVYNVELYVKEAIASILAQTYNNLEVIVINDGSTDNTANIVEALKASDSRIVFINNPTNQGVGYARNCGLREAKGEYLAFLDGDDIWLPDKIELQLHAFKINPLLEIVNCGGNVINAAGVVTRSFPAIGSSISGNMIVDMLYYCRFSAPMQTAIIRRKQNDTNMFPEGMPIFEDRLFILPYLITKNYLGLEQRLVNVRRHLAQATNKNLVAYVSSFITYKKSIRPFIKGLKYWCHYQKACSMNFSDFTMKLLRNNQTLPSFKSFISSIIYNPLLLLSKRTAVYLVHLCARKINGNR